MKTSKKSAKIEAAQANPVSAEASETKEIVLVSPWGKKNLPVPPKGAKQYQLTDPSGTVAVEKVENLHLAVGMKGSIQFLDSKSAPMGDLHQTETTRVSVPVGTNTATPTPETSQTSRKPGFQKGGEGKPTLAGTIDSLADGSMTAQEMAEKVASVIGIPVEKALRDVYGRVNWKNKKLGREELQIKGGNTAPAKEQPRKEKAANPGHVVEVPQPAPEPVPEPTPEPAKATKKAKKAA